MKNLIAVIAITLTLAIAAFAERVYVVHASAQATSMSEDTALQEATENASSQLQCNGWMNDWTKQESCGMSGVGSFSCTVRVSAVCHEN